VIQPHGRGADFQIVGPNDAVGDDKGASAGAGAAVAQAGRNAVEHRRKNAEDRDVPDEAVAQVEVAVAVHFLGVGSVGIGNEETAAEHAFEVVGARGPSFAAQGLDERVKVGVGGDQSKFVLGAAFGGEIKRSGTVGAAAEELGVDV